MARGSHLFNFLIGCTVGAGLMYVLDPNTGRRRRAFARDKVVRGRNIGTRWLAKQARNANHHVYGWFAERRARLRQDRVADEVLEERVKAQVGHVVSHPGSLEVRACDGVVTICGPILAQEIDILEKRLSETRGVRSWDLQVSPRQSAGSEPGLQGESRWERRQQNIA